MRSKVFVHFAIALILAGSAGYLSYVWLAAKSQVPEIPAPEQPKTREVVVAAKELPRGARITEDMLKTATFLEESLPADHFTDIKELLDRVVLGKVVMNEPILESKLMSEGVGVAGISPLVKAGYRAMGVQGDSVLGLAGFVRPGNKVDVMVTLDSQSPDEAPVTKLVLEKIPVLAAGTQLEHTGDSEEPSPVGVFTLEVNPDQAEILALASTQGQLHFALHNDADEKAVLTNGKKIREMLMQHGGKRFAQRSNKRKKNPGVELIRGIQRAMIRF